MNHSGWRTLKDTPTALPLVEYSTKVEELVSGLSFLGAQNDQQKVTRTGHMKNPHTQSDEMQSSSFTSTPFFQALLSKRANHSACVVRTYNAEIARRMCSGQRLWQLYAHTAFSLWTLRFQRKAQASFKCTKNQAPEGFSGAQGQDCVFF